MHEVSTGVRADLGSARVRSGVRGGVRGGSGAGSGQVTVVYHLKTGESAERRGEGRIEGFQG